MKSNNDRQNVILKQHQQELIKFMKVNMQKE